MRTSRIARDTSRIVAATRSQPLRRATAASLRAAADEGHESASDALSRVSSDDDSDDGKPAAAVNRKRKRGQTTVKHEVAEATVAIAASPKKKKARRTPAKRITAKDGMPARMQATAGMC